MKYDSTVYLTQVLKNQGVEKKIRDFYIKLFEGFVIKPGSIKYDIFDSDLSLDTLPNNGIQIYNIHIDILEEIISMIVYSGNYIMNININIRELRIQCALIMNNKESNKLSGICYYDSSEFNNEKGKRERNYSFYDRNTLETIEKAYLEKNDTYNDFIDIIGYEKEQITSLGFYPDCEVWKDEDGVKNLDDLLSQVEEINDEIKSISDDYAKRYLGIFNKKYSEEKNPITLKKLP